MKVHFNISVREDDEGKLTVRWIDAGGDEIITPAKHVVEGLAIIAAAAVNAGREIVVAAAQTLRDRR